MKSNINKTAAIAICHNAVLMDGSDTPKLCGYITPMTYARHIKFVCPKCGNDEKEKWVPTTIDTYYVYLNNYYPFTIVEDYTFTIVEEEGEKAA